MTSKKELQYAYGLAILFFVVGVLSYAAFPKKPPDQPIRRMYTSIAGNVLFDHQTHESESGFGVNCLDCHHHPGDDETSILGCSQCHAPKGGLEVVKETCLTCHDEGDIEDSEPMKRSDAFHKQCRDCHQEFGSGPQHGSEACSSCHVK